MKKGYKLVSLSLIIIGIVLCVIGVIWFKHSDYITRYQASFSEALKTDDITSLVVSCDVGSLKIITGDSFSIECKDIIKDKFSYNTDNGTLTVSYESKSRFDNIALSTNFGMSPEEPQIIITIPDIQLDSAQISIGVGQADIKNISSKKAALEVGIGQIIAKNCKFDYLNIDNGIGETSLENCTLSGNADLDNGIGEINLLLVGEADDYAFDCDNGIGEIRVGGKKTYFEYSSKGKYKINADNGIGEIQINFVD